jgi:chemotaxis methyl-accepting protein methylase
MNDRDCVDFLQWALPRMDLHWPGFRKVRGIVCMEWREQGFERRDGAHCVRADLRAMVTFARQDLREAIPDERFDLILCRNVVITYFEPELQCGVVGRMAGALHAGGALVVGIHESLPQCIDELVPWPEARAVCRRLPVAPDAEI